MGSIVSTLTPEEIQQAQQQAQTIAASSSLAVQSGQFVFFAAFDGTNNIRTNPGFSNDPQSTNVGQLAYQADTVTGSNPNLAVGYYNGPGTPGTLFGSSALPPQVTQEAFNTANRAYGEFRTAAVDWLKDNPGGSVTTAITGFSRGGPAAVVFAQMLNERGLIDPETGTILMQPGQVGVSAMLLFDPVSTGFSGDLSIPSNVNPNNIAVVQALDEFRVMYKGDDYSADSRVRIFGFIGAHGDVGGFYDQGLGALPLQGATGFFQNAGISMGDVPLERQFNADQSVIHTEGIDSYGNRIWEEYGTRGSRLMRPIGVQPPTEILTNVAYSSSVTLNEAGQLVMTVERDISGHRVKVEFVEDEWGDLKASHVLTVDGQVPANDDPFVSALNSQGYSSWDFADGQAPSGGADVGSLYTAFNPMQPTGAQTLANAINQYGGTLIDALSIIKAIQSGDPLPIAVSGLRLANDINNLNSPPDYNLSGAASIGGSILSILSLEQALQRGDTLAAVTAGAQALGYGASAYLSFASKTTDIATATDISDFFNGTRGTPDVPGAPGAIAYLNLVNDISHGDATGVAIDAMYFIPGLQEVAVAVSIFRSILSLFGDDDPPPEPWGNAWAGWSGFTAVANANGGDGGQGTAAGTYNGFIAYLDQLAASEQTLNPGSAIGVVANRLPSLSYRNYTGFGITDIDPITGIQRDPSIRYDLTGRPYNAPAGSEQASQSLSERFIRVALARGAVAPMWEVQTAAIQTQYGDPQAGLTEEERAGRNGLLAPSPQPSPAGGGGSQTFRPVALDLNGDGVQTTGANKTVAFDVDDSGYLKNTAWLDNHDGFLFLDRNLNGSIDSGRELFSNGIVDLSARGLAGMRWIDANYDGKLTNADPVWDELKVWQDANGDGQAEAGEVKSLAALGITALDYAMGRFEQNGQLKEMSSPDLAADTVGTRTHVIPEGIVVETSNGQVSLLATRIDDRTAIEANRDGITGFEDTETIVSGANFVANDELWLWKAA